MASAHLITVLLCSSVARTCKKKFCPTWLAVISGMFSSDSIDPFTIQTTAPVVTLQLKVTVDPSVALTDVGVLTKAEMEHTHLVSMIESPRYTPKNLPVTVVYPYFQRMLKART